MTPLNPLIRFRDGQKILFLSLIAFFLMSMGLIVHQAIAKTNYDILFITPLFLFCVYMCLTHLVNETMVWEEDGFLKTRSGPLPVWDRHPPIPVQDIASFYWEYQFKWRSYVVYATLTTGKGCLVFKSDLSTAIEGVNTLTSAVRGGDLKKDQQRFLKRIQDLKNGTHRPNFPLGSTDEDLIALVKQYTDKLITFVGLFEERQYIQWQLATLLKQNETRFRALLPTLNVTDDDGLFMIYLAMTKYEKHFQPWILSEVDRLFNDAIETQNTDLLSSLDAFAEMDSRQGQTVRQAIRERVLVHLSSPHEIIREQAVRFLGMMAEDNVKGTLNILSDVVLRDPGRRVRSEAIEQITVLNPDHRGVKLRGLDRMKGMFKALRT